MEDYPARKGTRGALEQVFSTPTCTGELIKTETVNPTLLAHLGFLMVFPKDYYEEVGEVQFGVEPVGSGPFKFESWQEGVKIELVRNDDYWGDKTSVSKVIYKPAPEASTRVSMLLTGEADIVANIPPEMTGQIEDESGARVATTPSLRKIFLEFNMDEAPFDDVRVRQAANYAVNKQALIDQILGGHAEREYGPVPDGWLGYNSEDALTKYNYDAAKATDLLEQAGYEDGFEFDFWYPIGRYLKDKEVAEAIYGQLKDVGMAGNMNGLDIGTLVDRIHTQTLSGLHFFSWAPLVFDTDYLWRAHFYSEGLNQYACDDTTDELLHAGYAIVDQEKRDEIYKELERYVVNDLVPWVFLYRQGLIYGVSQDVNWTPRPDEVIDVREITVNR